MYKKILLSIILVLASVLVLCSCEGKDQKTATSISAVFRIEGAEDVNKVIVTAKEKDTKQKVVLELSPGDNNVIEIEPGNYIDVKVRTNNKRISLSLNEPFFSINSSSRYFTFSVKEKTVMSDPEWFFYNNRLYLLCLVASFVALGVIKFKKEKKLRER